MQTKRETTASLTSIVKILYIKNSLWRKNWMKVTFFEELRIISIVILFEILLHMDAENHWV